MKKKICPIMSGVVGASYNDHCPETITPQFEEISCEQDKCALWIAGYTTEKLPISCCAFEMMALKNSEGQYKV